MQRFMVELRVLNSAVHICHPNPPQLCLYQISGVRQRLSEGQTSVSHSYINTLYELQCVDSRASFQLDVCKNVICCSWDKRWEQMIKKSGCALIVSKKRHF